ncbi:Rab5 binding protein [Ancylostoma duodenale]|uniref:Rab5 binding protein n=1 Tax=Ancylostoma duodenale TaxID=51022 RepID=A0A0C2HCF5_9BILA|nr:Rab5 binding protein [Ancylostoma duodenale]
MNCLWFFALRMNLSQRIDDTVIQPQENERKLRDQLKAVKSLAERYESELSQERKYRQDVEKKMIEHQICGFHSFAVHHVNILLLKELLGSNRATATEMRAEPIDLPQSADQLQFLCLQMREELIELKSARQHEQNELRDEVALLREQIGEERNAKLAMERDLLAQVNHLQTQLGIAASKLSSADAAAMSSESHSRQIRDLQNTVAELEAQVKQVW